MSRTPAAFAVVAGFALIAAAAWWATRPVPTLPALPVKQAAPVVLPTPPPAPSPPMRREGRVVFATGRTRRTDLPRFALQDLDQGRSIHQQAVEEIRTKVLLPCAPRRSLTLENHTRRIEVDYVLQPTGIVELQLRGVDADRNQVDVDPKLLDCVSAHLDALEGPAVAGELTHRFVFAHSSP